MSISTQGGDQQRQPSVVSTGKKPPAGDKPGGGGKPGGNAKPNKPGSPRPSGGGKGPRKPVRPVKVSQGRAWGPIALFAAVGVLAAGIIGYGAWAAYNGSKPWQDRADEISGIVNFRKSDPKLLEPAAGKQSHEWGPLQYTMNPPVGGSHNFNIQNCMGDVYEEPIANEHAIHSMEHGAVWITYKSGLPADQVATLATKVKGKEFIMMSPIEGLDKNVTLQAWGYQLKVDTVTDPRIDDFIKALRQNATMEPGAPCSEGITATGTTPRDVGKDQPQQPSK